MVTQNAVNEPTAAAGKILRAQGIGTASAYSTATYPDTAGTSGNILTSDGTNWTSAAPSGGAGSLVFITSKTASSSADITFDSSEITATYPSYLLTFYNALPANTSNTLQLQYSTDNGSSYITSGYLSVFGAAAFSATAHVLLSIPGFTSNSVGAGTGQVNLYNITTGGTPNVIGSVAMGQSNIGAMTTYTIASIGPATTTVNNIKIFYASGNITSGTFVLYGIKQS